MSPAVEAFANHVKRFCEWSESDSHDIGSVRQLLLALMQGIPTLQTDGLDTSGLTEYEHRGSKVWERDFKRLADLPFQYYRVIFDPLDIGDDNYVMGDLHDDLADIYGDLWHGLQAYNAGDIGYAVDYWRSSYDYHWGHHAADALWAVDAYSRKSSAF